MRKLVFVRYVLNLRDFTIKMFGEIFRTQKEKEKMYLFRNK